MSTYKNVLAWQKAVDLVDRIYETVQRFPSSEAFVLSQQMRRAAISIPCNIAEGRGRHTNRDYAHFLYQARGSVHELDTQLEIAVKRQFISADEGRGLIEQANEVGRLINSLLNTIPDT